MKKGILAGCMLVLLSGAPATFAADCPGDAHQYPGEYSETQKTKGSYLGVEVADVESDRVAALKLKEEAGVEVTAVDEDAPAGKAGFKEHDVILSVNGTKIESEEQLRRTIRETPAGRAVDIVISRDGQQMTLKPTLGSRTQSTWMGSPHPVPVPDIHVEPHIAPMPPQAFAFEMPDIPDVRVYTNTPRVGAMIENLTPQLGDFFGVKNGSGLLVRSVEKGSAAEAGGLKAGDVIIRVGTERVNDASDWRRAIRNKTGSVQIGIVRDKREQNVTLKLPARRESGALINKEDFDWDGNVDMEALRKELSDLPKITAEQKMAMLRAQKEWKKDFEAHRGEWQKSIAEAHKEASKSQKKAMEDMKKEMEKMQKDMQKNFHFISFDSFE
jgi:membrane-associated protease RseP (regulator of RpoE activity)